MSAPVKATGMEFGTNSFDPKFDPRHTYGTNLKDLAQVQDYLLFENHSLPTKEKNNNYIHEVAQELQKPVFVVSYKKGIGADKEFMQEDFNNIYTEDQSYDSFNACLKGCEYYTDGKWHNLRLNKYGKPQKNYELDIKYRPYKRKLLRGVKHSPILKWLAKNHFNLLLRLYMEVKLVRRFFSLFFYSAIQ